jgi:hypothetical protein
VSAEHLCQAAQVLLPTLVDEEMLAASLQEVNDLSLLPERYRQRARARRQEGEERSPPKQTRRRART